MGCARLEFEPITFHVEYQTHATVPPAMGDGLSKAVISTRVVVATEDNTESTKPDFWVVPAPAPAQTLL